MAKRVTGLGRGLEALLPADDINNRLQQMKNINAAEESREPSAIGPKADVNQIQELPLNAIRPTGDQPRKYFDELTISELAQSIFERGLLQPILVMPVPSGELLDEAAKYSIIAGERRFRACQVLRWQRIPAIVKAVSEVEQFELALIENIQREDLTPIDEALAYQHLLRISGMSQNEMAKRLGKGRSALANSLRLLQLPSLVQDGLSQGLIRSGHAKALLMIKESKSLLEAYQRCLEESWTVRQVERYCQEWSHKLEVPEKPVEKLPVESVEVQTVIAMEKAANCNDTGVVQGLESQLQTAASDQRKAKKIVVPSKTKPSKVIPASNTTSDTRPAELQVNRASEGSEYWGVYGMLFREEELEGHLAKALHLDLKLHLEGNLNDSGRAAKNASAARPRKALLQVEFENQEQWELWLNKLGLNQVLDTKRDPDAEKLDALFS